jgi:hypothetical protein
MSSETSTESPALPRPDSPAANPAFEPWQLFTLAGLIGATLAVFMARGESPSAVILISLTVFAAAAVGLAALRTFLPLTHKAAAPTTQILGGRTRAALEREKALALRAIKELEFDHAMGKVSEKDFAEMSGRLRARAGRLMRQLDAGVGYRADIEREVQRRIGDAPASAPVGAQTTDVPRESTPERMSVATSACASCGTVNDADARFCKNCGTPVETRA